MRAFTRGFNVMLEKESVVLKKKATILKFQERLDHGNGGRYLLAARLYASPNDAGKTHSGGNNTEGKTLTKAEGTESTTENTAIKCETTGNIKVDKK